MCLCVASDLLVIRIPFIYEREIKPSVRKNRHYGTRFGKP